MKRSLRHRSGLAPVALLAAAWLLAGPALAQERPLWWDGRWRYRTLVRVDRDGDRGRVPAARVRLHIRQGADNGGRDIRIIGPTGQRVPFDIVYAGPDGQYLLVFETRGPQGLYALYYGNPNAGDTQRQAPAWGLVYETRPIPPRTDASTWQGAQEALQRASTVYGADYWPRVFDGLNPFGPESDYIALYRGHIRCPTAGSYRFSVISDHSAYLLVDNQLVAEWPGPHNIWQGRKGEHSGSITLTQGMHEFLYVHFSYGSARRAAAAWIPPGKQWWEIIPPAAFPMPLQGQVYESQEFRQPLCADFTYQLQNYLEAGQARLVTVRFSSVSSAEEGLISRYEWDFGDGQVGTDARPAHVYLAPGLHHVTLRVTSTSGQRALVTKTVNVRPTWRDLRFTRDEMRRALEMVGAYRLDRLPTAALLGAWEFFREVEAKDRAFEAARRLDARRAELDQGQIYELAMDLARRYLDAGEPQKAEEYLELALDSTSEGQAARRFEARFAIADLHFHGMDDPERAREEFEKLREDFPKADPGRRREALIRIGDTYRAQANTDEALKVYEEAESDPAYRPDQPRRLVVAAGLQAVESYLRRGEAEEALKQLDELLWRYPTMRLEGRPTALRVQAALMRGDFQEARRLAETFIAFSRDVNYLPAVHLSAAEACNELGLLEETEEHYRKIVDDFPESPEALEARAGLRKLGE